MLSSVYAEDIFLRFYALVQSGQLHVQHQDFSPILSFHEKISNDSELTKNQANYILKILEKYKNVSASLGFDYTDVLPVAQWQRPFRVLDLTKRIYVENKEGSLEICLKFPYQLKKEFDDEINVNLPNSNRVSHWDQEDKVRRLKFYEYNLISLYEFANKHNFVIDDSFMSVLSDVEEIWQNSDDIIPCSEIINSKVELVNADAETKEWWTTARTESLNNDLLLAKSMGFPLKKNPVNLIEKIASSSENLFWIKNIQDFFNISTTINGRVCIILDRTSDTLKWLQEFLKAADQNCVSREEIKVCFRDTKDSKTGLNDWIKLAGVGGKVDTGKFLIFEAKPAKWLFKDNLDVKMLVTNNIYPPTSVITKDWFDAHPCVIYLGTAKPSTQRGRKIVEL